MEGLSHRDTLPPPPPVGGGGGLQSYCVCFVLLLYRGLDRYSMYVCMYVRVDGCMFVCISCMYTMYVYHVCLPCMYSVDVTMDVNHISICTCMYLYVYV